MARRIGGAPSRAPSSRGTQTMAVPTGSSPSRFPINPSAATWPPSPPHSIPKLATSIVGWKILAAQPTPYTHTRSAAVSERAQKARPPSKPRSMDVYISEEYVMKRRAERRAARDAAAAAAARGSRSGEKAAARADGCELMRRWTGAWAEMSNKRPGANDGINASAGAGGGVEDVVFSYFSA